MTRLTMACASVVLAVQAAAAAPDKQTLDEVDGLFHRANELMKKGQLLDAIGALEQARKLDPDDQPVLFSLARLQVKQFEIDHDDRRLEAAVSLYHVYLTGRGDQLEYAKAQLKVLEPQLDSIRKAIAARPIAQEPPPAPPPPPTKLIVAASVDGSHVALDGGPPQEATAVFETTGGRHHVVVTKPGYKPAERDAIAKTEQTISIEVPLVELPAPLTIHGDLADVFVDGKHEGEVGDVVPVPSGLHRVTVVRSGHYAWQRDLLFERGKPREESVDTPVSLQRKSSWIVLGSAGLFAIAGGLTTTLAYVNQSHAQDYTARVAGGMSLTDAERVAYNNDIDRRDRWRTTSYVLFGASLAAAATGALLYALDTPRVEGGAPPPLPPTITPITRDGAIGMAWQGRF